MRKLGVCIALAFVVSLVSHSQAAGTVKLLVLRENGLGSSAKAQPFVDEFMALAAKRNGWPQARGKYVTTRRQADAYIASEKPQFGIFSLGSFLAYRTPHKLELIGSADVAGAGGRYYHIISKEASNIAECKGKKLASDHVADVRFIDKVVSGGQFKLADFTVVTTRRPVQTIKYVARSKAVCALVDDAQHAELSHIRGADGIRSVWRSVKLPPMAIVAFTTATASEKKSLRTNLPLLCKGAGKKTCQKVGIQQLKADPSVFKRWIDAYEK